MDDDRCRRGRRSPGAARGLDPIAAPRGDRVHALGQSDRGRDLDYPAGLGLAQEETLAPLLIAATAGTGQITERVAIASVSTLSAELVRASLLLTPKQ